jgi:N-methylhydantoinase A
VSGSYSLGVDIGGTFTDIILLEQNKGIQYSSKVLTTHDDPSRGVLDGVLALLARHEIDPARIQRVVHATTLFTNALIERKGARTGLLTTEGFRDNLELGRERKYELYDLNIENPRPLVPRDLRLEVIERVDAAGAVLKPLDEQALMSEASSLLERGVTSIAVVFLHAYANPAHERAAAALLLARHPDISVTTSHEVVSEIREFERASTTVANAYIKPLARKYLDHMAAQFAKLGVRAPLLVMLSNGGMTHLEEAKRTPVQLLESGPAAGALAAAHFGGDCRNLLAFDMGGTTAKLSLIDDGEPLVAYGFEAARQKRFTEGSGLPIRISTIELIEIGAGGGSIAHVDEIGLLKVGPQSAGSEPGPACYARGGLEPTVTDANLVLGYLNPDYFAGGTIRIDVARAEQAICALAQKLGITPVQAAWGIHDVVNENMASAARVHVAERGRDVRKYSLLTTGGGGPLHGGHVAAKLGLSQLICPASAGVASALGLLAAPAKIDRVATINMRLDDGDWERLEAAFVTLESDARAVIEETGYAFTDLQVARYADGRYAGQGFNLLAELPPGPYDSADAAAVREALQNAFEKSYRGKFAKTPPAIGIEFINIRVSVAGEIGDAAAVRRSSVVITAGEPLRGHRQVYFQEARDYVRTAVYDRSALGAGSRIDGPAVVEEAGSTLVIAPGASATVAESGNMIVTLRPRETHAC